MATVGVVILSYDGMKYLAQCLESVAWADRVLLLHTGRDPEVGREYPGLTVRRLASWSEFDRSAADIGTDWVLCLWGDERLDDVLAGELQALKSAGPFDSRRAAAIPLRSYILNQWVEGGLGGPSPSIRLARGAAALPGWWPKAAGADHVFHGWIEDRGTAELSTAVDRAQALSDFWATRLKMLAQPPSALKSIVAALVVKVRMLLRSRFGARGLGGVALAALASYSVLLSGAKVWEARHVKPRPAD
jgi:hypothetical protein